MFRRAAVGLALASAVGCGWQGTAQTGGDPRYPDTSSFRPDRLPASEASLILAGTRLPVELKERRSDGKFEIVVLAHGEDVEVETYLVAPDSFSFAGLSGESFEPPIPILRFPLVLDGRWDWAGKAFLGPVGRPARAAVAVESESLNLASGTLKAVRVDVDLSVETGKATTAKRELKFWLAPDSGVVRREFGSSSLREPRAAEDQPQ
jgi:hypothetical protein